MVERRVTRAEARKVEEKTTKEAEGGGGADGKEGKGEDKDGKGEEKVADIVKDPAGTNESGVKPKKRGRPRKSS